MTIETPDSGATAHEALDRCHVITSMIDDHLLGHPYVQEDTEVKALVEQASAALAAAYQLIGAKRFAEVLEDGREAPADDGRSVVAWARRWLIDGETPKKERKENGRMAWPARFKLLPITTCKCLVDDVPLYRIPDEGA